MPTIKKQATVPYSAAQMYELVNDIASYPEFVPYCKSSRIMSRSAEEVRAELVFAKGNLKKSFSTLNRLQPSKMMEMRLLDGPFKHLEGYWRFQEKETGCQVSLDLSFEFSTRLVAMMFGPLFQQVANRLVTAFVERANQQYGE